MQDGAQFLKVCIQRYDQAISRDYFIYQAFHYEFCLQADNRKQFVVVTPWLELESGKESRSGAELESGKESRSGAELESGKESRSGAELESGKESQSGADTDDFSTSLRTMCDWYKENYTAFSDTQPLTFARLYFYLPVTLSFVHEAYQLWEKLQGSAPPVYDAQQTFWRELLAVVQEKCPHHQLLSAWLQWRYGERHAPPIVAENLPPNPFVERRTFGMRRGSERREGRGRDAPARESGARRSFGGSRREGAERRDNRRDAPRRNSAARRDDSRGRARPSGREGASHRATRHVRQDEQQVMATLTEAMTSEIEAAIALLQDDNKHPGVTLKPANSYYRRLQHKMVANLGFTSISVGDERENRAVKIVRDA